jgi:hypothetical protein
MKKTIIALSIIAASTGANAKTMKRGAGIWQATITERIQTAETANQSAEKLNPPPNGQNNKTEKKQTEVKVQQKQAELEAQQKQAELEAQRKAMEMQQKQAELEAQKAIMAAEMEAKQKELEVQMEKITMKK